MTVVRIKQRKLAEPLYKGCPYHSEFAVSFPGCGQKVTVGIKTRYQQR